MISEKILSELQKHLSNLLGNRLVGIYLFGSRARGDQRADSDVDVLVVLNGDFHPFDLIEETGNLVASLSLQFDLVISLAFVSRERFENENSPFMLNVRREGVPV
jgi:uncharacterized protein